MLGPAPKPFNAGRASCGIANHTQIVTTIHVFLSLQVDQSDPPFPRPTAHWWYGCKNTPSTFNTLGNVRLQKSDEHPYDIGDLAQDAGK